MSGHESMSCFRCVAAVNKAGNSRNEEQGKHETYLIRLVRFLNLIQVHSCFGIGVFVSSRLRGWFREVHHEDAKTPTWGITDLRL